MMMTNVRVQSSGVNSMGGEPFGEGEECPRESLHLSQNSRRSMARLLCPTKRRRFAC